MHACLNAKDDDGLSKPVLFHALKLLTVMRKEKMSPTLHTYNANLEALADIGKFQKTLDLLHLMPKDRVCPDIETYVHVLRACRVKFEWPKALHVLQLMQEKQRVSVERRPGDVPAKVFVEVPPVKPDDRCYEHAILSCTGNSTKGDTIIGLFVDMRKRLLSPTVQTYNAAIHAYARRGEHLRGLELIDEIFTHQDDRRKEHERTENLRRAAAGHDIADFIEKPFDEGQGPDVGSFEAALVACDQSSRLERAVGLLEKMGHSKSQELRPDGLPENLKATRVCFHAVLSCCARAGNWLWALGVLDQMKQAARAEDEIQKLATAKSARHRLSQTLGTGAVPPLPATGSTVSDTDDCKEVKDALQTQARKRRKKLDLTPNDKTYESDILFCHVECFCFPIVRCADCDPSEL